MAFNIEPGTFDFLSVAKDLYDYGLLDKVVKIFGSMEVCEDWYSIAWEGIVSVFEQFRHYYKEKTDTDTMVFCDSVITGFYQLCFFYEAKSGISRDNNPFRWDGESAVYQCFHLDAYDYEVLLYDGTWGCPRMVILSGEEFCGHQELPRVLAEVKDTFESYCRKLKAAIVTERPVAALPEYVQKEAA